MTNAVVSIDDFQENHKYEKLFLLHYNGKGEQKNYRLLSITSITEMVSLPIKNEENNWLVAKEFYIQNNPNKNKNKLSYQTSFPDHNGYICWDDIFNKFTSDFCKALYAEIERCLKDPELTKIVHLYTYK